MQSLKSFINRMRRKPRPRIIRVQPSDDGFLAIWRDEHVEEQKWSEVERIITYKVDCYIHDMIWLAFERRGHDEAIEIPEEAEGFADLMAALGKTFPEIDQEWYFTVMDPVFAENFTLLYQRKADANNSPPLPSD